MILFWLSALALIAVALAFVLPPLLGKRKVSADAPDMSRNLEVYRSRIAALEEQFRVRALTEDGLAQAKDELARELLADASASADPTPVGSGVTRAFGSRPWLAIALGVGIPLLTIILYQRLGEPDALEPARAAVPGQAAVEEMVTRLAKRLQSEPDNGDGWLLLGRSYMVMERFAAAAGAFAAANRLLGDSAELLSDLAEAEALMAGQNFLGAPSERLERALQLDPEFPKALWLGAFAAMQRGETALAVRRWQSLLDRQPADSEPAKLLRRLIADSGVTPAPANGAGAPASSGDSARVAAGPVLTVSVNLADGLGADLDGSETLFVFARAAEGPPMPLAVARKRVSDLPLTVILDDSMAMTPDMRLSRFERVVVGARIARSGTATASSGDLQGISEPVRVLGDAVVNVTIAEEIP